jgi:hypothetical protein
MLKNLICLLNNRAIIRDLTTSHQRSRWSTKTPAGERRTTVMALAGAILARRQVRTGRQAKDAGQFLGVTGQREAATHGAQCSRVPPVSRGQVRPAGDPALFPTFLLGYSCPRGGASLIRDPGSRRTASAPSHPGHWAPGQITPPTIRP